MPSATGASARRSRLHEPGGVRPKVGGRSQSRTARSHRRTRVGERQHRQFRRRCGEGPDLRSVRGRQQSRHLDGHACGKRAVPSCGDSERIRTAPANAGSIGTTGGSHSCGAGDLPKRRSTRSRSSRISGSCRPACWRSASCSRRRRRQGPVVASIGDRRSTGNISRSTPGIRRVPRIRPLCRCSWATCSTSSPTASSKAIRSWIRCRSKR